MNGYEEARSPGLFGTTTLLFNQGATNRADSAPQDRELVADPSPRASSPPTLWSRPRSVPGHRLLRDLTAAVRWSTWRNPWSNDGHRRAKRRRDQFDSIVFATGFDAMTGALDHHRHPWPDGSAPREVGEVQSLSRSQRVRIPTCSRSLVPRPRSPATWSCPSNSTWTGSPTVFLCAQRGAPPHRRRRSRPSVTWGKHVA